MAWKFTKGSAILLRKPNSLLDFHTGRGGTARRSAVGRHAEEDEGPAEAPREAREGLCEGRALDEGTWWPPRGPHAPGSAARGGTAMTRHYHDIGGGADLVPPRRRRAAALLSSGSLRLMLLGVARTSRVSRDLGGERERESLIELAPLARTPSVSRRQHASHASGPGPAP